MNTLKSNIIPIFFLLAASTLTHSVSANGAELGSEKAVDRHLADGEELILGTAELIEHGRTLFTARWTQEDGAGRPFSKGTGGALSDAGRPLVFPRNFNRISGPDANACSGCHNQPRAGGSGDQVANVFVLGQRFDFVDFDALDLLPTAGTADERGLPATLAAVGNERNTVGLFGAGYIEMLARQLTEQLRSIRDAMQPGDKRRLVANGIDFGRLGRRDDGSWDTSAIDTLTPMSLASGGPDDPPSLVVRPFHQASAVISLRQFTNNAFNHHHGMQSTERFGATTDADGDGVVAELTRGDITAATLYQAALPVPGRIIPRDAEFEEAIRRGESTFGAIGCAACHRPELTLEAENRVFSEPNPYNPPGNLQAGEAPTLGIDLADKALPGPRLGTKRGSVAVPLYTDFRLHDISGGPGDPNCEPLDMHHAPGADTGFFDGNCRFLTARLWDVGSSGPYFHHGKFTTLREAIEAHAGDASASRAAWDDISDYEQAAIIEFLKSLRVLPADAKSRVLDERMRPRPWSAAGER